MPGYYESYQLRNQVRQQGMENFQREFQQHYGQEASVVKLQIDSLDQYDFPLGLEYKLMIRPGNEDLIVINPLFGEGYKSNPFQAKSRKYPVEMPYALDETFLLTLAVPEGYEPEFLPRQIIAKIDSAGENIFEYLLAYSGNTVSLRSSVKLSQTVFQPGEYEALRNFFDLIVSKQNEQIVFRKIK